MIRRPGIVCRRSVAIGTTTSAHGPGGNMYPARASAISDPFRWTISGYQNYPNEFFWAKEKGNEDDDLLPMLTYRPSTQIRSPPPGPHQMRPDPHRREAGRRITGHRLLRRRNLRRLHPTETAPRQAKGSQHVRTRIVAAGIAILLLTGAAKCQSAEAPAPAPDPHAFDSAKANPGAALYQLSFDPRQ